jgi:hypothetical protein
MMSRGFFLHLRSIDLALGRIDDFIKLTTWMRAIGFVLIGVVDFGFNLFLYLFEPGACDSAFAALALCL